MRTLRGAGSEPVSYRRHRYRAIFCTLKQQIVHGRIYQTIDQVRDAVRDFIARYNAEWLIEKTAWVVQVSTRAPASGTHEGRRLTQSCVQKPGAVQG